jgi:hypothetical protein
VNRVGLVFMKMSYRKKLLVLASVCLIVVLGYYNIRSLFYTPSYPDEFQIVLKYGVNTRNVLNTSAGTFTKDLVLDGSITTNLKLTEREMDMIWRLIQENEFYTLEEQYSPRASAIQPEYKYSLYVHAEGYPDRTIIMSDIRYDYESNEAAFLNITKKIVSLIESKPAYKKLPNPRGGYA